jgi:hypothetical protein
MRVDFDLALPQTDRELFFRIHKDRGLEWGLRRRS